MTMKKVAMIGPELYPIPPIRGGATELFIEKVSQAMTRYKPMIFSPADPALPDRETRNDIPLFSVQGEVRSKKSSMVGLRFILPIMNKRLPRLS